MSDLKTILTNQIRHSGPMTLADYMSACLLHPKHGYYNRSDPFGRAGDFITAPEISQMFGELVGLCLAQSWIDRGAPSPFVLAELGPGRGTLMADILRATKSVAGLVDAAEIWLVEASEPLRQVQAQALGRHEITWVSDVSDLPAQTPLFLVANEFFDALPIRQFQRNGAVWQERMVGVSANGELQSGWGGPKVVDALDHRLSDTRDGDVVEYAPLLKHAAQEIGQRVSDTDGVALMFDYGDWRSLGDTFQALRKHQHVDPFAAPGEADLTAHVDFEAIAQAAPARCSRLTPQGVFLERLGITDRAKALAKSMTGKQLDDHIAAHWRLTHPTEMGTLFKVMSLTKDGASMPPGLDK